MPLHFRIVATQVGRVAFVASTRGLRRVYIGQPREAWLRRAIRRECPAAVEDDTLLPELADALRRYFDGERVEFDLRLDCEDASDFHVDVWHACRQVGYGKTVSYGDLAARVGRPGAGRAVGTAMRRNRFPIVVPCHRVLRSDGSLGGYSGSGGVELKRRLLEMESAPPPL